MVITSPQSLLSDIYESQEMTATKITIIFDKTYSLRGQAHQNSQNTDSQHIIKSTVPNPLFKAGVRHSIKLQCIDFQKVST